MLVEPHLKTSQSMITRGTSDNEPTCFVRKQIGICYSSMTCAVSKLGKPAGKDVAPLVRHLPRPRQQSRSPSPTSVAEYQTALPSKALLWRKLHELYAQLAPQSGQ